MRDYDITPIYNPMYVEYGVITETFQLELIHRGWFVPWAIGDIVRIVDYQGWGDESGNFLYMGDGYIIQNLLDSRYTWAHYKHVDEMREAFWEFLNLRYDYHAPKNGSQMDIKGLEIPRVPFTLPENAGFISIMAKDEP